MDEGIKKLIIGVLIGLALLLIVMGIIAFWTDAFSSATDMSIIDKMQNLIGASK